MHSVGGHLTELSCSQMSKQLKQAEQAVDRLCLELRRPLEKPTAVQMQLLTLTCRCWLTHQHCPLGSRAAQHCPQTSSWRASQELRPDMAQLHMQRLSLAGRNLHVLESAQ